MAVEQTHAVLTAVKTASDDSRIASNQIRKDINALKLD